MPRISGRAVSWENQADINDSNDVTDGSLGLKIHDGNLPDPVTAEVSLALRPPKDGLDDPLSKKLVRRCCRFFRGG